MDQHETESVRMNSSKNSLSQRTSTNILFLNYQNIFFMRKKSWNITWENGCKFSSQMYNGNSKHFSITSWGFFFSNIFFFLWQQVYLFIFFFWTPLPPPSPQHLSRSSPCTSPKQAAPYVRHGLAIQFLHDSIHVIIPILPNHPTLSLPLWVQKSVIHICVFFPVLHTSFIKTF